MFFINGYLNIIIFFFQKHCLGAKKCRQDIFKCPLNFFNLHLFHSIVISAKQRYTIVGAGISFDMVWSNYSAWRYVSDKNGLLFVLKRLVLACQALLDTFLCPPSFLVQFFCPSNKKCGRPWAALNWLIKKTSQNIRWKGKERNVEIVFKNCVYTHFLYLLTCPVRLHPFTEIPVQND